MKIKFNVIIPKDQTKFLTFQIAENGKYELSPITFNKLKTEKISLNNLSIIDLIVFIDNIYINKFNTYNTKKQLIGIDGMSNSFKTTYTNILIKLFPLNIFRTDHYYLIPPSNNLEHGNNINYEVIINEIINKTKTANTTFTYPIYLNHNPKPVYKTTENYSLTIIEGVYSLNDPLLAYYDYKILFKTSKTDQLSRLHNREPLNKIPDFLTKWIPLEQDYLTFLTTRTTFDLIINT